jgi:hypothetical protein
MFLVLESQIESLKHGLPNILLATILTDTTTSIKGNYEINLCGLVLLVFLV